MKLVTIILITSLMVSKGHGMRCGNQIVNEEDSEYILQQKCGQPNSQGSDIWGDKKKIYYNGNNGEVNTITILNGRISNIQMNRR